MFCNFNKKRKVFVVKENSGTPKRELLKHRVSFPILIFEGNLSINDVCNDDVMNLGIARNFYISIDPDYPRSCARRSIVAVELRGIWVLPSP